MFFYYLFFYFHLCFFSLFDCSNILHYSGIIEIYVRPDKKELQDDLALFKENNITQDNDRGQNNPLIITNTNIEKKGFALYDFRDTQYQDLHYTLAEKIIRKSLQGIEGIHAFYRGYASISNDQGRLFFPRLDDKNEINVLLVENVTPIIFQGQVPDHFIVLPGTPYQFYICTGEKNETNNTTAWEATMNSKLQPNQKIPLNTIIIIVNPNEAYFDLNKNIIQQSANMLLPNIYIFSSAKKNNYSHFALNILNYFKPFDQKKYTVEINEQLHRAKRLQDYIF